MQSDRMDKSALGFQEQDKIGTNYTKVKPDIGSAKPSNIRARFENFALAAEEETRKKAEEQKRLRLEKDKKDREEASKRVVCLGFGRNFGCFLNICFSRTTQLSR